MGKTSDFRVLPLKSVLNDKNSPNFLSWNPNTFFRKCSKAELAKKKNRKEKVLEVRESYLWCVCTSCTSGQTPGIWKWRRWHSRNCLQSPRSCSDGEKRLRKPEVKWTNIWLGWLCVFCWQGLRLNSVWFIEIQPSSLSQHALGVSYTEPKLKAQHGKRRGLKLTWVRLQNTHHPHTSPNH